MSSKHVYIFTECSEEIGFGHISRCCAFYDEFVNRGCKCEFVIDGEEQVINLLLDKKYRFVHWKKEEVNLSFLKKNNIILADTITATQQQIERLISEANVFAIIDDYQRRSYKNTIIIDWTPCVEQSGKHNHNIGNGNKLLLDLPYSVLRPQFFRRVTLRDDCRTITIIMGGSDYRRLSQRLTNVIAMRYPNKNVNVVIGPMAKSLETSLPNVTLHHALCADALKELFEQSDVVVSAGGQTLLELAAMRIPTIGIQVVDNQTEDVDGLLKVGFLKRNIQWNSKSLEKDILEDIEWFANAENRNIWRKNLTYEKIGEGATMIVDEILRA